MSGQQKIDGSKAILTITHDMVMSVYSGKLGCACGCRGKHTYNSKHVAAASTYRGYEVKPNEVNNGQITRVLNMFRASVTEDNIEFSKGKDGFCDHFALYTANRMYVIYLVR